MNPTPPDNGPRNRRARSSTQGDDEAGQDSSTTQPFSNSPFSSPRHSRPASPIPSQRLSRPHRPPSSWQSSSLRNGISTNGSSSKGSPAFSSTLGSGLFEAPWSALQGLASTVLGSDSVESRKSKTNPAFRPPARIFSEARSRWTSLSADHQQWGPDPGGKRMGNRPVTASRESREQKLRIKRRQDLLSGSDQTTPDLAGNYKRRVSDDRGTSSSAPPKGYDDGAETEALAYLHHVKPHDTLAGVVLQYSCQPGVLRKANRLWPQDSIQSRQTVLLPVDACGVKGRPISAGSGRFGRAEDESNATQPSRGTGDNQSSAQGLVSPSLRSLRRQESLSSGSGEYQDAPAWKHDSWVHIDGQPSPVEIVRMPRKTLGFFPPRRRKSSSFDQERMSSSLDLRSCSDGQSPKPQSRLGPTSYFAQHLHGPGGVGTLDAGVRSPGPAQDGLNKYIAPHLPSVVPRESFESASDNVAIGLENVGNAIEGWMKKVATRAVALAETATRQRRSEEGDLIELLDSVDGSDDGLSRDAEGTAREDAETALRERFPMRGLLKDEARKKKGD